MSIDEQSYLLCRAARSAWAEADGDTGDAVALLMERILADADLREYVASIAIAEIRFDEVNRKIGIPVGRA